MRISSPTYLIAELAGDVVPVVEKMRQRFNPDHVGFPVEITIAGSSGVGTIKEGQELNVVIDCLEPIIKKLGFNGVEFISVNQFPNTGIYYLEPERSRFDQMHNAVIGSGVEFNENEWPYNPHCTLRFHSDDTQECKELFQSLSLPGDSFVECFSLYRPEENGCCRVHEF